MDGFEEQLRQARGALERFVRFRIGNPDAEDLLQEISLTAYQKYGQLKDCAAFKSWIFSIARNRCNDYFRMQRIETVPLEEVPRTKLVYSRQGLTAREAVADTMAQLGAQDREILWLYFWKELPQQEIARRLGLPLGTVKSRLHHAKKRFRDHYPYPPREKKGANTMTKLPEFIPDYTIKKLDEEPFACHWEELLGWLIVPRLGEKITWGMYDFPDRRRTEYTEAEVIGRAEVHGIEGVEIVAMQFDASNAHGTGSLDRTERRFVAQLTDTHSRYLAETHVENGVRKCHTFLDGDEFLKNWGYGENNCGNEIQPKPKGILHREGSCVTGDVVKEMVDVVGRYKVTIGGKSYDTICIMDVEYFDDAVATEQYVDQNGRTVLWRRFNRNDWAIDRFGGKLWSEKLPKTSKLPSMVKCLSIGMTVLVIIFFET